MELVLLLYIILLGIVCLHGIYNGFKNKRIGYSGKSVTYKESALLFYIGMVIYSIGILTVVSALVVVLRYGVSN